MKKIGLLFILTAVTFYADAQSAMITLKKGHKTIERYFSGDYINCRLVSGEWMEARITKMHEDSIQLKPFELVQYMNSLGIPYTDTLWKNKRDISLKEIDAFPRRDQSFSYIKNGAILQIIGGGYILLNVINTLSDGDKLFADNNGVNLAIAAAVVAVGTIMHASHSPVLKVGRKYKLQYVELKPTF